MSATIERLHPGPRMSQAVAHGNVVYLAGQVAADPSADVPGQRRQVLADIGTFAQMNSVWDA